MRPDDRQIRIAGAVLLAAGLVACGLAILTEELGLGAEGARGTFGWKRASLLIVGVAAFAMGAALMSRPRIVPRPLNQEGIRAHVRGLSDRDIRIAGAVALIMGLVLCGLALFARPLEVTPLATAGLLGWRQLVLVFVGGPMIAAGGLLLTRARRTRWRADVIAPLYALGFYAVIQFVLLKPPELSDQLNYFATADELPDVTANHRNVRLGLLFSVRGFIELFGYSEAAYYAVPVLSGLALAAFTYVLARMLFGWAVGVAAALLVTLNPYVLWDSSHLLPDVPAAAALVGAMAALVGAGILHLRPRVDVDAWAIALLVAGGFLFGWAYLTREYLLGAFPLALVIFFAYRIPWRRLGWVALGAAPPLIVEAVWGAVNYGDPLIRFTTSAEPRPGPVFQQPAGVPEWEGGEFIVTDAWDVIGQLPSHFLDHPAGWVFVALFLGTILYGAFAVFRQDRRFLPIVAWVGGMWLALTAIGLVPIVLTDGEALLRLQVFRYWVPIMPGLVIGGVAVVQELIRLGVRNESLREPLKLAALAGVTVATLSAGVSSISHSATFVRNGADQFLALRDFLRDEGASDSRIYTDQGAYQATGLAVPMYTRSILGSAIWEGDIRPLGVDADFLSPDEISDGLVVVRPRSIRWLASNRAEFRPPHYLTHPPAEWQPAMVSDNGHLVVYRVAADRPAAELYTARARDWHIVEEGRDHSAANRMIADGRAIIEMPDDASVLVFDREGASPDLPEEADDGWVESGEVAWGRVEMATEGFGFARIRCYFDGEESTTIIDAAAREPHTDGVESIDYRCPAPESGGPFRVRVAIEVRGPLHVTLGENVVRRDPNVP